MLLFIEGYPYTLNHKVKTNLSIKDILEGIVSFPKMEKIQSFDYVGYCYSKKAKDVVFFLPKVILTGDIDNENHILFLWILLWKSLILKDNTSKKNSQKKVVKSTKIFSPIFLFGFIVPSVYIRRITMIIYLKAENTKKRVAAENKNTIPY